MKKLMILFAISCLVLVMAGSTFASGGDEVQGKVGLFHRDLTLDVDLKAIVHAYAKLDVCPGDTLYFDGFGRQTKGGDLRFLLWNNYDVCVKGEGNDFGTFYKGHYYTLATSYAAYGFKADKQFFGFPYPGRNGFNSGIVRYEATTGDLITSQPAGDYKANYKFTVSSDWKSCYGLW